MESICAQPSSAEAGEAIATDGGGEHQAIGDQMQADLAEEAGDVIDHLQVEQRDDQVVVIGGERQVFRVDLQAIP